MASVEEEVMKKFHDILTIEASRIVTSIALEREDLYQEGLIILLEFYEKHRALYVSDPTTFLKMLRVRISNAFIDIGRKDIRRHHPHAEDYDVANIKDEQKAFENVTSYTYKLSGFSSDKSLRWAYFEKPIDLNYTLEQAHHCLTETAYALFKILTGRCATTDYAWGRFKQKLPKETTLKQPIQYTSIFIRQHLKISLNEYKASLNEVKTFVYS